MMSLRRYYHRHFGHHERFHVAVILTIVIVAYVVVPVAVRYIDALQGYSPAAYEPKDRERQELLSQRGVPEGLAGLSWEIVVNTLLVILVAVVWLTLVPTRASRPRSRTRSSRATRGMCPGLSTSRRCAGRSSRCAGAATSAPSVRRPGGRRIPCATCGRCTSSGAAAGSPCSSRRTAFSITWRGTSSAARSPWGAAPASPNGSRRCSTRATGASLGRRPRRRGSRWFVSFIQISLDTFLRSVFSRGVPSVLHPEPRAGAGADDQRRARRKRAGWHPGVSLE